MVSQIKLRIGTRGSPLALAQARQVRSLLCAAHDWAESQAEIVPIVTTGDRITDRTLAAIGGKGLFTKEIEDSLLDGRIDLAVHSLKDVATVLPEGLGMLCFLEREDPRDAVIAAGPLSSLDDLAEGAIVGTASLRRAAQMKALRPDFRIEPLRGNVGTRLDKIKNGEADASLLALAGLNRLGLSAEARLVLSAEQMLPALCQGIVGIEARIRDDEIREVLKPINHGPSAIQARAERALLATLDGSCRTPMAGLARLDDAAETLTLDGALFAPDGSEIFKDRISGKADEAEALGQALGKKLIEQAGEEFMTRIRETAL